MKTILKSLMAAVAGLFAVTAGAEVELPSGYTQLDYIESTGQEYIDTKIDAAGDVTAVMDFMPLGYTGGGYLGTCEGGDSSDWRFLDSDAYGTIFDCGNARVNLGKDVSINNKRVTLSCGIENDRVTVRLDDSAGLRIAEGSANSEGTIAAKSIRVFGIHQGWGNPPDSCVAMRLYSLKLKKGGTLVRDFVPCQRDSDGAYGLYDRVEGMFYGNKSGKGAFVGPTTAVAQ